MPTRASDNGEELNIERGKDDVISCDWAIVALGMASYELSVTNLETPEQPPAPAPAPPFPPLLLPMKPPKFIQTEPPPPPTLSCYQKQNKNQNFGMKKTQNSLINHFQDLNFPINTSKKLFIFIHPPKKYFRPRLVMNIKLNNPNPQN